MAGLRFFKILFLSLVFSLSVFAESAYYDELFTSQGEIREHYRPFFSTYEKLSQKQKEKLRKEFKRKFDGDNSLAALPRVLTQPEYLELKRGVEQRGKAILLFLKDYYSGDQRYLQVIPEKVLQRIIERTGEAGFVGLVDPQTISFPYGPDVIRDSKGRWKVLEDNVGFIGGMGDLVRARQILRDKFPEYRQALEQAPEPEDFYKNLLTSYRQQMKNPEEAIVIFSTPPYADHEDPRLHKIWQSLGVEVVTAYTKNQLQVTERGVYLVKEIDDKTRSRKKVGFVIVNTEHDLLDLRSEASQNLWFQRDAQGRIDQAKYLGLNEYQVEDLHRALRKKDPQGKVDFKNLEKVLRAQDGVVFSLARDKRLSVQGILEASRKGQVVLNYSAGIDFVGDKEFYTYVEELIRFYLREEPVIRNVETQRLYVVDEQGRASLNKEAYADLKENIDQRVAKIVDGRGGDGVYVFPKITDPKKKQEGLEFALREFDRMIGQEFTHPSVLAGDITDTRALSYFASTEAGDILTTVSTTPWSRGVPMSGDGKVNLSSHGHEFAVIVMPSANRCAALYKKAAGY